MMATPYYDRAGDKFYQVQGRTGAPWPSASLLIRALTHENFERVPLHSLEKARLEGEGAHKFALSFSLRMMGASTDMPKAPAMPSEYPGDSAEWDKVMYETEHALSDFFVKHIEQPVAVEQPSLCFDYEFGGQPDLMAYIRWHGRKILAVIDYKRVAVIMRAHHLKMQSYFLLEGYKGCKLGFLCWLKKGGGFELVPIQHKPSDKAALCGIASALRWQQTNNFGLSR